MRRYNKRVHYIGLGRGRKRATRMRKKETEGKEGERQGRHEEGPGKRETSGRRPELAEIEVTIESSKPQEER
jgi:hypothetical protein